MDGDEPATGAQRIGGWISQVLGGVEQMEADGLTLDGAVMVVASSNGRIEAISVTSTTHLPWVKRALLLEGVAQIDRQRARNPQEWNTWSEGGDDGE